MDELLSSLDSSWLALADELDNQKNRPQHGTLKFRRQSIAEDWFDSPLRATNRWHSESSQPELFPSDTVLQRPWSSEISFDPNSSLAADLGLAQD